MTLELVQPNSDFACVENEAQKGEVAAWTLSQQWWLSQPPSSQASGHSDKNISITQYFHMIFFSESFKKREKTNIDLE